MRWVLLVVEMSGFAALILAAFLVTLPLGFAALGLSLLVLGNAPGLARLITRPRRSQLEEPE